MKENSIKYNALMNILLTLSSLIFPLISFPYVTRILSVESLGQVNFMNSVGTYAIMFAGLGIGTYGIRACSLVRDNKEELSKTTHELLFLKTISTTIVIVALFGSVLFVKKFQNNFSLLLLQIVLIISNIFSLDWFFSGLEKYSYITKRSILFKFVSLVLLILFVKKSNDAFLYSAITVFSLAASYVCNLIYSRKFVSYKKQNNYNISRHLRATFLLFAATLAVSIYTSLDTVMLGFINGDKDVGYYTVAVKVKTILLSLVNAVSAVLLPRLSYYAKQNKRDEFLILVKKSILVISMLAIPMSLYFIFEAQDSVCLLASNTYLPSVLGMQILMPILIISGFSNIVGNQILLPRGQDKYFMCAVTTGAVVDFLLNLFLLPRYGFIGAAIATLIAEVSQASIQTFFAKDIIIRCINIKELLKIVISSIMGTIIVLVLRHYINYNAFINLVITVIGFACIYVAMLWILKVEVFLALKNQFLTQIKYILKRKKSRV